MEESSAQTALTQAVNTWVKRSPLADTPPSPRLGYEGACVWDGQHHVLIHYAGHNQGGGGEQNSEVWTFDPLTAEWTLKEPNTSPPGLCCGQQNVFDPTFARYIRFPAFSGSHGWQWHREIYLNDSSVWNYDLAANTWRNMRPLPTPNPRPLRCASWDSDNQVIVMFGGETSQEGTLVYEPYTNRWTLMNTNPQPDFRSGGNMAYDAARKLHILFGAQFIDDGHTWAYHLRENKWYDMQPEIMPPTNKNDAVLTGDAINKVILALVNITEGEEDAARYRLETWAYDADANKWTKMNPKLEPDSSGNRARQLMFAKEYNLALLENSTHPNNGGRREQQIWTYRFAEPKQEVNAPPTDVRVTTAADSATLAWKASASPNVKRYAIYRGTGEKPWLVDYQEIATVDAKQRTYHDGGLKRETVYHYVVHAVDANGYESAESAKALTQPQIVEDVVLSVLSAKEIELNWKSPAGDDVSGYHIERAVAEVLTEDQLLRLKSRTPPLPTPSVGAIRRVGRFACLTETLVEGTKFTDTTVDLTKPETAPGEPIYERRFYAEHLDEGGEPYRFAVYAYRIRAVNALGVMSGPSPAFFTIPSAPQFVFAREEGTTCHLKWAANPEKNTRGYRVYRMDGRWDKDKITRLTQESLETLTYSDQQAGSSTRRYYVVAVDALGQEGFPSSPVWFNREWKRFYEPFTSEWHQ